MKTCVNTDFGCPGLSQYGGSEGIRTLGLLLRAGFLGRSGDSNGDGK